MSARIERVEKRILDFDIENRPLSYWMADRPTADITSIASAWIGDHDSIEVLLLAPPCYHKGHEEVCPDWPTGMYNQREMLERFLARYNRADIVTGHYIRKHDLPIINGALYDHGLPLLEAKLTSDTKLDMFKKADIPATQEFLLELLEPKCPIAIPLEKHHMSQRTWREANRLGRKGVESTKVRVSTDVHAHWHMREEMLRRGMLRGPRMWNPGGGFSEVSVGRSDSGESK
jgi:hypothetical protein